MTPCEVCALQAGGSGAETRLWASRAARDTPQCVLTDCSSLVRGLAMAQLGSLSHLPAHDSGMRPIHQTSSMWLSSVELSNAGGSCTRELLCAKSLRKWELSQYFFFFFFNEDAQARRGSGFLELSAWQLSLRCMQLDFNSQHAPAISTSSKGVGAKSQKWELLKSWSRAASGCHPRFDAEELQLERVDGWLAHVTESCYRGVSYRLLTAA